MIREESPFRLLVEGLDDQHSVLHLMARHGCDWNDESFPLPHILSTGSIDRLLESLAVSLKTFDRIGVLVDADESPANRWAQLRDRAQRAGVQIPATPEPDGTIVSGPIPGSRIGFWMMPDNAAPGTLESFLGRLVPADDPTWSWAGETVQEARRLGARCKEIDHPKSRLHTWLAWQERPGIPFGIALQAQVFRHDTEDALRFVAWFKRLFVAT